MAYTTINDPSAYFQTKIYTGNNTDGTQITNDGSSNLQPDWLWIKNRTDSGSSPATGGLWDSVRGFAENKVLTTFSNNLEGANSNGFAVATTNGFTVEDGTSGGNPRTATNLNAKNYVAWQWKANGQGSSNTDGAITSTVSANTTSGFSIVKWTANGANGNVVGHGLGATPQIVIYKKLTGTNDWYARINGVIDGSQDYLVLNSTNGKANDSSDYPAPTNTLMTSYGYSNGSSMIAYAFAEKTGYSKFGSYVGNGNADGAFIYLGFKPAFVMVKRTDTTGNWNINDTKRDPYNRATHSLYPNLSNAENATGWFVDYVSNGFKIRDSGSEVNASGGTYIYMAFAEAPLVGTNNIPANAR